MSMCKMGGVAMHCPSSCLAQTCPSATLKIDRLHQQSKLPHLSTYRPTMDCCTPSHTRISRATSLLRIASPAADMETSEEQPSSSGADSMDDYAKAKELLLARAKRAGGFLAAYLFLSQSGQAALCALTGSAAGYLYLILLIRNVDKLTPDTWLPYQDAQQVTQQPLKALATGLAAYRQALQPRLLVPILLAAAVGTYNRNTQQPLTGLQEFEILLGFLTYKAGLFLTLWDDSKPKFGQAQRAPRPTIPDLPDVHAKEVPESQAHKRY